MALVDLAAIEPLLACPRCRSPLARDGDGLRCTSVDCALSSTAFTERDRRPVLVDADASIVVDGYARPEIERVPRRLRALWKPPNHVAARELDRLVELAGGAPTVLVVGGASVGNGVDRLYGDSLVRTIAFDLQASPVVQFVADAHDIPLVDGSVDAVVVQAVLEHVLRPERVVAEIHRVLRVDGFVYAETPFLQQVHGGAHDFTRYTASGHRWLFRAFEQIEAGVVAGPGTQLLWSVDHLVRGLTRSELAGKAARGALFFLRSLDRFIPDDYGLDGASCLFFLGRRTDRELSPAELVASYPGAQDRSA